MKQVQYSGEWTFSVDKSFILNPDINIEAKAVYLALKSFCAPGIPVAFPKIDTLQTCLKLSRGRLYKYLRELNVLGLLIREQSADSVGKFGATIYTLRSSDFVQKPVGGKSAYGKASHGSPPPSPTTPTPASTLFGLKGEEIPRGVPKKIQKQAEEIYALYPRKVGRPLAIRAIIKALAKADVDVLLALTKKFAAARKDEDPNFTPHPATWFNQERYLDDPSTWGNGKGEAHQEGDPAGEIQGQAAHWTKRGGKWVKAT